MSHLRRAVHLVSIDTVLQFAVGMGHSFMLTQVLDPGVQHESLDEVALLRQIFEHIPVERAVAAALGREHRNGIQERPSIGRLDLIFHGYQHRSSIGIDIG